MRASHVLAAARLAVAGFVVAVVFASCVTSPAVPPKPAEIPVIHESQDEWERALPARLSVVRSRVEQCYEAWVRTVEAAAVEGAYVGQAAPVLAGRVELELSVGGLGRLGAPAWSLDELQSSQFRACVDREVARVEVPPAPDGEAVSVTVPFRFAIDAATE